MTKRPNPALQATAVGPDHLPRVEPRYVLPLTVTTA